jgi:hypothetical protein
MVTKEEARQRVAELVAKFEKVQKDGKLADYDEENTKNRFIEPLFEALGWDMRSEDLVKEKRVRSGKADYAFQINEVVKLFVEAKAARHDIADNWDYARQSRAYGAHKMVEWAMLTNFKTLQVFNCFWETQNPYAAQVGKNLNYTEFVSRFDELWLLSKDSFSQSPSLLDKTAEGIGRRFKRISAAELISKDLLKWRAWLSKDYAEQNPGTKPEVGHTDASTGSHKPYSYSTIHLAGGITGSYSLKLPCVRVGLSTESRKPQLGLGSFFSNARL